MFVISCSVPERDQDAAAGRHVRPDAVEDDEPDARGDVVDLVLVGVRVRRDGLTGVDPDVGDVEPARLEDRAVVGVGLGRDGEVARTWLIMVSSA